MNKLLFLQSNLKKQFIMNNNLYLNKYRISTPRAPWHNYNGGMYFVTICTKGREHYFGKIVKETYRDTLCLGCRDVLQRGCRDAVQRGCRDAVHHGCRDAVHHVSTAEPTMVLSNIGQYADEQFRNVQNHYPYAEIPLWVVMPNHIHAIVIIDHNKIPYERRTGETERMIGIETGRLVDAETRCAKAVETCCSASLQRNIANMQGWLSVVVGGLKRAVTYYANQHQIPFAWQPRFHDHIIRDINQMNKIADYIENNVVQWEYDKYC